MLHISMRKVCLPNLCCYRRLKQMAGSRGTSKDTLCSRPCGEAGVNFTLGFTPTFERSLGPFDAAFEARDHMWLVCATPTPPWCTNWMTY